MFEECTSGQMKSCCPFHFRAPQHTMSHTPIPYKERRERFIICMLCCTSIIRQLRRGDSPRKNPPATVTSCSGHKMPNINFWAFYQTNASFHCSSLLLWGWFYLQIVRIRNFFFDHELLLWINKRNFQILKPFNNR